MFIQEVLPSPVSDHIPILVQPSFSYASSRPFRFELMWLKIPGFVEKVKLWWKEFVVEGSASFLFVQKLKHLKEKIVKWKNEVFGEIESRKFSCLQKIESLKQKDIEGVWRRMRWWNCQVLNKNILGFFVWRSLGIKNPGWHGLKEDKNTKFFHKMAS